MGAVVRLSAEYGGQIEEMRGASEDKTIRLWDAARGATLLEIHTSPVWSAAISPDGKVKTPTHYLGR
jgi:WD40 repeat protein